MIRSSSPLTMLLSRHTRRRAFITLLGGAAVAAPLAAWAQQRTILPQVGILDPGIPQHFEAFRRGMRDLGYVEGNSISYIYRTAAGRVEPVSQLASELVALKPDVIVAAPPVPVRALREATSTIPIVFAVGDAITAGSGEQSCSPWRKLDGLIVSEHRTQREAPGIAVRNVTQYSPDRG